MLALLLAMAAIDAAHLLDAPAPSLVMLYAPWCAPCRAELKTYPALAAAAAPLPLIVVVTDGGPGDGTRLTAIPRERRRVWPRSSAALLRLWPDDAAGLPFAAMIDLRGRTCAVRNGGLNPGTVAAMRAECAAYLRK